MRKIVAVLFVHTKDSELICGGPFNDDIWHFFPIDNKAHERISQQYVSLSLNTFRLP